jgi:hypothetical protein
MIMAGWYSHVIDVEGAFLHGEFDSGEEIHAEVPQGWTQHYDPSVWLLLLLKTAYGLKQAAMMFWKELVKAMNHMGFTRNEVDPCLYWKWTDDGLVTWLSWVDDCMITGDKKNVEKYKEMMKGMFDCDDVGELKEYVGCKLDRNWEKRELKITQPVLLQSFSDEFELPTQKYSTPAEAGKVLMKAKEGAGQSPEKQTKYRSGIGKLLHMMRWSRPEIWNAVRDGSRHMSNNNKDHNKSMGKVMKYCVDTPKRGWFLKPSRVWDGVDKTFEFILRAKADSNFATCTETRRSITGLVIWLEDAVIAVKSGMQRIVALSVTEAEVIAMVQAIQELLFAKKLLEAMELKVALPMIVAVDNKGAVDLANGWSNSGGTKHMDVRIMFVRELKEEGIVKVIWIPTAENESDIFTKNTDAKTFNKHIKTFCGTDEYCETLAD